MPNWTKITQHHTERKNARPRINQELHPTKLHKAKQHELQLWQTYDYRDALQSEDSAEDHHNSDLHVMCVEWKCYTDGVTCTDVIQPQWNHYFNTDVIRALHGPGGPRAGPKKQRDGPWFPGPCMAPDVTSATTHNWQRPKSNVAHLQQYYNLRHSSLTLASLSTRLCSHQLKNHTHRLFTSLMKSNGQQ